MNQALDGYAYSLARIRWDVFGSLTFRSVPSPKRAFGRAWAHMHHAAELCGRPYSKGADFFYVERVQLAFRERARV
jgi:hypothetical protein